MKCVLHIGTEKTGTSVIQNWLIRESGNLEKHGIYLPKGFGQPNNWHFPVYFHSGHDHYYLIKESVLSPDEKEVYFQDFTERFEREIKKASGAEIFLITSEHFHSTLTDPDEIWRLRDFLFRYFSEIQIVCYFREQAEMAISRYSTFLKGAGTLEFEDFASDVVPDNHYYNFARLADHWSEAFGRKNCMFRIYDRSAFPDGDIRLDFLEALGISSGRFQFDPEEKGLNTALSILQARAFLQINLAVPYFLEEGGLNPYNVALKNKVMEIDGLRSGGLRLLYSRRISERFREVNADFFKRYFSGEGGFHISGHHQTAQEWILENRVDDLVSDFSRTFLNELLSVQARDEARKADFSVPDWIVVTDYWIHKGLSRLPFASRNFKRRFYGAAERRRAKLAETLFD